MRMKLSRCKFQKALKLSQWSNTYEVLDFKEAMKYLKKCCTIDELRNFIIPNLLDSDMKYKFLRVGTISMIRNIGEKPPPSVKDVQGLRSYLDELADILDQMKQRRSFERDVAS